MLVSFNPSVKFNRNSNPGVLKKPESKSDPSFGVTLLHEVPTILPKNVLYADDLVYSLGLTIPATEKNMAALDKLYLQSTGIVQKMLGRAYVQLEKTAPVHPNPYVPKPIK